MKKTALNEKGLTPNDPRIKDYILYERGNAWTPERFYDFILINKTKPYKHDQLIKSGFILTDIERVINRFDGISFEYLGN